MYRSARAAPSLLKYSSFAGARCGPHGRQSGLYTDGALLLSGPDAFQTSQHAFLNTGSASFPRTLHSQRYSFSEYLATSKAAQFGNQSQRFFSRSCDEDIDKKTPLASAEEGKDEVEESKKAEATQVPCELPSESETTSKPWSKNVSSEVLHAEEQEEPHQGTQQEAVDAKPSDKGKKKEGGKVNPLKMKLKKMLISWDKIDDSFTNFPYYLK